MNKDLLNAFKTARYEVLEPNISIKIGLKNSNLDQLLLKNNSKTWAFITPFNPKSKIISESENNERLEQLKKEVLAYKTLAGVGGGQEDKWPLEKSLLILDISLEEAKKLGKKFQQDAIVFGLINKEAEIVVTSE